MGSAWAKWRGHLFQPGIARRFTLWVLLFSSCITLLGTSLQLYFDYRRDLGQLETRFQEIHATRLETLQEHLWLTNNEAALMEIQGMVRLPDLQFLEIRLEGGETLRVGAEIPAARALERKFTLNHYYRGQWHHLGELRVQSDLGVIYQRLWDKLMVILVTQAIKTFLVSLFIIGLFYHLVGRHLMALAAFADQADVRQEFTPLVLKRRRSPVGGEDELDRLMEAINRAGIFLRKIIVQQQETNRRLSRQVQERKLMEQELRRRSDQYVGIVQATRDGFWMLNGEGALLDVNPTYVQLTGYSREGLRGSTDDRHRTLIREILAMDSGLKMGRHPTRDGAMIPLEASVTSIPEQGLWLCFFRDVRSHLALLETVRHERDRMRQYLDIVDVIILVLDVAGRVVSINRKGCVLLGVTERDVLGASWFEGFVEDPLSGAQREVFQELLEHDSEAIRYSEYEILTGHGGRRLIQWRTSRIRDEGGRVVGTLNAGEDITDQRQAEMEILQQSERFRALVEASQDGYWLVDPRGRILDVNEAYCRISGYDREALLGKPIAELEAVENPSEIAARVARIQREGRDRFETFHYRKNGEKVQLEVSVTMIASQGLMVSFLRDITQLRQMEERLRQGEKMQAMGQLAGGVAHDLNNQLGGIMGYAELIRLGEKGETVREQAREILVSAQRAADLTRNLLAFARRGKMLRVSVDLVALMGEVVSLLKRSIDKRITLEWPEGAAPALTPGDPGQLQNALLNLALNARDAMPEGGRLTLSCAEVGLDDLRHLPELTEGAYWRVRVRDTGVGMGEEVRRRMFEPFFTTKEEGRGTGLGLSSVYGTVHSHHGAIEVESEEGKGSCFTLYLPLTHEPPREEGLGERAPLSPMRILVADDEAGVRSMLVAMLQADGHRVTACVDGVEALKVFRQNEGGYDLVILDQVMPHMRGGEVFRRLREMDPGVRVLMASGYSLNEEIQGLLNEGCGGFISKPFLMNDLRRKLREVLR